MPHELQRDSTRTRPNQPIPDQYGSTKGARHLNSTSIIARTDRKPSHAGATRRPAVLFGATFGNIAGVTTMVGMPLGAMLVPISINLGWTRTAVSGAFLALSLAQAVCYPLAGRMADRYGSRPTLLVGFTGMGLTLLTVAFMPPDIIAFYALFALAGAFGVLASTMVIAKLVAEWFTERLGFWLGFVGGVGNGLGGMFMPGIAAVLAATLGWRNGFAAIGAFILLVGLPMAWATLHSPPIPDRDTSHPATAAEPAQQGHSFRQAMRSPLFWAIFTAVPIGGGALTGVFANTVTILMSQHIGAGQATLAVTLLALTCVIVEPLVGHLLDSASRPRHVAGFYLLAVVGLMVLAHAPSGPVAMLGGVLTGLGLGAEFSVLPYMLARYFGRRQLGAILGVAYAGALISNGISPIIVNAAYDRFGSYAPGMNIVAALMVYAFVVFLLLPRFDRDDADQATRA
jgi:MFS family permease